MLQTTLDLDTLPADHADRVGFDIGWDHAHHGLVPPAELMQGSGPLQQGWTAARAVFGSRTLAHGRPVRQWLALRLQAWREGAAFETLQLTPNYLAQLDTAVCPVTRRCLGGTADDAPLLQRLQPGAAYAAGHLAVLSSEAAAALASLDRQQPLADAWRHLRAAAAGRAALLDIDAWQRLAVLVSFVTPLPHAEAARVPLTALPPNRLRVLNPIQGLQAVLTWQLAAPGWSARLRAVAALIDDPAARHEFMLFVGALAPRVMDLPDRSEGSEALAQRQALEDLWRDARVQRRWTLFALLLDEAGTERLAARAAAVKLAGRRVLVHGRAGATEGWLARPLPRSRPEGRALQQPAQPAQPGHAGRR